MNFELIDYRDFLAWFVDYLSPILGVFIGFAFVPYIVKTALNLFKRV